MQGFNMGRYMPPEVDGLIPSRNRRHSRLPPSYRSPSGGGGPKQVIRFEMPFSIWCNLCEGLTSTTTATNASSSTAGIKQEPGSSEDEKAAGIAVKKEEDDGDETIIKTEAGAKRRNGNPTIIPQGTRFNAQKQKTGAYHTTPIYTFSLKHPPCGGTILIRTDPANTTYVVVQGGRRREVDLALEAEAAAVATLSYPDSGSTSGDASAAQDPFALVAAAAAAADPDAPPAGSTGATTSATALPLTATPESVDQARQSALSRLEKTITSRTPSSILPYSLASRQRIESLSDAVAQKWADPYSQNQLLRKSFRAERHAREQQGVEDQELKKRFGLGGGEDGLVIVRGSKQEQEEDARRVSCVEFGVGNKPLLGAAGGLESRGIFDEGEVPKADEGKTMTKAEMLKMKTKAGIRAQVASSIRKRQDPFGVAKTGARGPVGGKGVDLKVPVLPGLRTAQQMNIIGVPECGPVQDVLAELGSRKVRTPEPGVLGTMPSRKRKRADEETSSGDNSGSDLDQRRENTHVGGAGGGGGLLVDYASDSE